MENPQPENVGSFRAALRKTMAGKRPQPQKRRPVVDSGMVDARCWLALDHFNSFPVPKAITDGRLKGEAFRFYCACLFLAARYGNPFNHSDTQFIRQFGFFSSRLHIYKRKLEELGLIDVALVRNSKLIWPKSHYLILEFWSD